MDSNDNGKPTCCGPGDLSACLIETSRKPKTAQSEADLQAESLGTDEMTKSGKAQPEAAHENPSQKRSNHD